MSVSWQDLLTTLKSMNYEINTNGKYAKLRPKGSQRFFRFDKLGEGYTESSIKERIRLSGTYVPKTPYPKRMKYNGSFRYKKKASGLKALYLYYCYQLGVLKKRSPRTDVYKRQGVHTYNAPIVPEQSIRGGVQVRKADAENNTAQGNGTLAGTQIEIINNNANTVTVNGVTYQPGEVVLTLTTSEDGTAVTAADTLPYGHYRYRESVPPTGYQPNTSFEGTFDITENGVIVDLTGEENTINDSVRCV